MGPYERRRARALALADAAPGYARVLSPERQDNPALPWLRHGSGGLTPYTRQMRRQRDRQEEKDVQLSSALRYWLGERPALEGWGLVLSGRDVRLGHLQYLGWRRVYD